jgi:hypothetical protein
MSSWQWRRRFEIKLYKRFILQLREQEQSIAELGLENKRIRAELNAALKATAELSKVQESNQRLRDLVAHGESLLQPLQSDLDLERRNSQQLQREVLILQERLESAKKEFEIKQQQADETLRMAEARCVQLEEGLNRKDSPVVDSSLRVEDLHVSDHTMLVQEESELKEITPPQFVTEAPEQKPSPRKLKIRGLFVRRSPYARTPDHRKEEQSFHSLVRIGLNDIESPALRFQEVIDKASANRAVLRCLNNDRD